MGDPIILGIIFIIIGVILMQIGKVVIRRTNEKRIKKNK